MRPLAHLKDALTAARELKSEHGENPEYDRALVELIVDIFHVGEFGMDDGRYIVMRELGMDTGMVKDQFEGIMLRTHMEIDHIPYDDTGRVVSREAYAAIVHTLDHSSGEGIRNPHTHEPKIGR